MERLMSRKARMADVTSRLVKRISSIVCEHVLVHLPDGAREAFLLRY
jgi:hypothetical protein